MLIVAGARTRATNVIRSPERKLEPVATGMLEIEEGPTGGVAEMNIQDRPRAEHDSFSYYYPPEQDFDVHCPFAVFSNQRNEH